MNISDYIDKPVKITCGSSNSHGVPDTTSSLRKRLNTVHLDVYGSFGGDLKFEKDSTWIIRKTLVANSSAISLESSSKPGYYLHCTSTGRARIESAKHKSDKFKREMSWIISKNEDGSVKLKNLADLDYYLIINSHGQARLVNSSENYVKFDENSGNWWFRNAKKTEKRGEVPAYTW